MSDQSYNDRSADVSLGHSGRSCHSGRSAEKSQQKDVTPPQSPQNVEAIKLNKSNVSELSKKERLALIKLNKKKYTFTDKNRCSSISNTLDVNNKLTEIEQLKMRIRFNQDITQSRTLITQNEESPEFKKIKRIVTLKKIRRPKSPTFTSSPTHLKAQSSLTKGISFEEKGLSILSPIQSNQNYNSSQKDILRRDSFEMGDKLNKSDIVHTNRDLSNEKGYEQGVYLHPNQMRTGQKFLMRQIYQQQVRAIKSMSKVKSQLERSKSPVHSNSQIFNQENTTPKNENSTSNLSILPPRLLSSKQRKVNEDQSREDQHFLQYQLQSPQMINKLQRNYLKQYSKKRQNSQQNIEKSHTNNSITYIINESASNIQESNSKTAGVHSINFKNSSELSIQHNLQNQQQQQQYKILLTDPSVQQLNGLSNVNKKQGEQGYQVYLPNNRQNLSGNYQQNNNSQINITNTSHLIREISKTYTPNTLNNNNNNSHLNYFQGNNNTIDNMNNNNFQQGMIENVSTLQHTISNPQNIGSSMNQQQRKSPNHNFKLQLQINPTYDQIMNSDISPIAIDKSKPFSPLSSMLKPLDQSNPFIPYHKQPNLKKYILQDDNDSTTNIVNYHTALQNSGIGVGAGRKSVSNNQKKNLNNISLQHKSQFNSIRKKMIYDKEFYEAEIKAIDISNKDLSQNYGKKGALKAIDKALPFTNNLIKEKIKNLLDNGQFINPLPKFQKNEGINHLNQLIPNLKIQHSKIVQNKQCVTPTAATSAAVPIASSSVGVAIDSNKLNQSIFDRNKRERRNDVRGLKNKSYIKLDKFEIPSFQSRSPSFINHYKVKQKQQNRTNIIETEPNDFSPDFNQNQQEMDNMILQSDDGKLSMMKNQIKKYIDQRSRTPLHQNFNKNKKLLYQNSVQLRLDTL